MSSKNQRPSGPIFVCCSQAETGGPEYLHQLVHELRECGREAFIDYYPFGEPFTPPKAYACYNAPQRRITDDAKALVILPEVATAFTRSLKRAQKAILWLSVDNYYQRRHVSRTQDFIKRYKTLVRARASLFELRRCQHFAQSHYALHFLRSQGFQPALLGDYLSPDHLKPRQETPAGERRNCIIYNPQKGFQFTQRLMAAMPDVKFVPLANMTQAEVVSCFREAKVYIDFGHHPGKDRAPREAAIHGCCVITGRRGSAAFSEDVPIPEMYKLDESKTDIVDRFRVLVESIFADTTNHAPRFQSYRDSIMNEPSTMRRQVEELFGTDKSTTIVTKDPR